MTLARDGSADRAKEQSEIRLKKQRDQAIAAQAGVAAEVARAAAEREKTARLRALRLAKEEADRIVAAATKAQKPAPRPKRAKAVV